MPQSAALARYMRIPEAIEEEQGKRQTIFLTIADVQDTCDRLCAK